MTFSFIKPPAPITTEPPAEPTPQQTVAQVVTPDPVVNPTPAVEVPVAVEPAAPISVAGLPAIPQRFNVQVTTEPAVEPSATPEPEAVTTEPHAASADEDTVMGAFFGLLALLAFSGAKFILTHTFTLVVTLLTYVDEDIKAKYITA